MLTKIDLTTKEDLSNKVTNFGTINDTLYPTVKAVNDAITTAVIGLLDYRGSYDASTNLFPATGGSGLAGAILKGDFWICSVTGTLGGTVVTPGDLIIALVDTPAQTASNWDLIEHDLSYVPENITNKVTSISGTSTDVQYPSAKLLYDQLALKENGGLDLRLDQTTPQSVINGKPTFSQGIFFGTTPTVGVFAEGKIYYDTTYKTLSCNIDTDVNMQIGQETFIRVINNSGSDMLNGQAVYITGASGIFPTISLAKADVVSTAYVAGVLTQNINNGAEGMITVRGIIHDVNTNGLTAGAEIYLSDTTAGAWTTTSPTSPSVVSRIGRVIVVDATAGSILVNPRPIQQLSALSDVNIMTPVLDQFLRYNGSVWVNGPGATSSASNGINFYYGETNIIPISTNNTLEVNTFSKTPDTTTEQVDTLSVTNNTVIGEAYLYNTALGRTSIDAGVWSFTTYASVNSVAAGRVSTISQNINRVRPGTGTVTITGTAGTSSRTATASTGTPFAVAAIDVGGTIVTDSYLETPLGLFRITARTSDTVVTIATPTTYSNESTVSYEVWKRLLTATTPTITSTGTNYQSIVFDSTQQAFTVQTTDKLGSIFYGTSNNTTTVNFVHSGTIHNSFVTTPLITLHNNLAGLQGGVAGEYYHLTSAEYSGTGVGTGNVARLNSPAFTTPDIGSATGNISGNAGTSTKLAATKTINGVAFDGSANIVTEYIHPSDHNLLAWNYDPIICTNTILLPTAGLMMTFRIFIPYAMTISNIWLSLATKSTTATNSYVALYQGNNLLAQSADQSTAWNAASGIQTISITPQSVTAGSVEIAIWCGSWATAPTFHRAAGQSGLLTNVGLSAANSRCASADGSITTTAPTHMGTHTVVTYGIWVGLS